MNITPKELRKLWVAALRSGKFKQGKGHLHKGDEFCCLGVGCEVCREFVPVDVGA